MKKNKPTYEELERKVLELERFIHNRISDSDEKQVLLNEEEIKELNSLPDNIIGHQKNKNLQFRTNFHVSEKLYHSLLDNIDAGIVIHAPDTSIIISNPKASELLGLSEDQMYGKLAFDPHWRFIYENGDSLPIDYYPVNQIIKDRKSIHNMVLGVNRPFTNDIIWLIVNGFPVLNENKEIVEIIISFIDITERKIAEKALHESELKYRLLIENSSVGVFQSRLSGEIIYANNTIVKILGFDSVESLLATSSLLVHKDLNQREIIINQLNETGKISDYELPIKTPDGTEKILLTSVTLEGDTLTGTVIDITERKQSEEALHHSEQNWRTLVNTVPDFIALHDADGRYLFLNHYAEGFSEKDVIGQNLFEFMPEENRSLYRSNFEACIKTRQIQKFINNAYGANKTTRTYDCYMVPIINNDETINVLSIAKDITEQKIMEDSLRNSEAHYRLLTEDVTDVVWKQDSNNLFTYISPADEKLRGFKSEEMIGKHVSEILTEDGFALVNKMMQSRLAKEQNAGNTGSLIFEVQQKCKDGSLVWTEVISTAEHDTEGKINGFHGISRDITERKKAEEALRETNDLLSLFMEISPIYTYIKEVTPTESRVLRASENFQDMIGIPGSQMAGKTMSELFPEEFAKKISADDWDVVLKGKEIIIEEELNGRYYTTIKYPITSDNKNLLAGYTIDITERKKIEITLEKNFKELEELNAEKDKFFSIIAHDLRSPFNIFLGFTQLMVEDLPKLRIEEIQNIALLMRNSANNLYNLLDNLLEWSRMQRGITHFEPVIFSVKSRITDSIQSTLEMADKKGIEFELSVPDDLTIFADENMFESIIRNLTSNATKFTSKGGKISISASSCKHECRFKITDTGIGMDDVLLGRLFHLDEQSSRKGTDGEPSTGLGLIICKDFVEKHGGKIWAESEEGRGSKFYFTIPIK